jgi:hypothetical protein
MKAMKKMITTITAAIVGLLMIAFASGAIKANKPFIEPNKEYVASILTDGSPEDMDAALKTTEIARAYSAQQFETSLKMFVAVGLVMLVGATAMCGVWSFPRTPVAVER